ncbi:hypothetical protein GCM10027570_45250 [Streptomonospora sediminis]
MAAKRTGQRNGPGTIPRPPAVAHAQRRLRILAWGAGAVALALVAGTIWWAVPTLRCGLWFNGVRHAGGECVGVTDGSYAFTPQLQAIGEAIKDENDEAAREAAKDEDTPLVKVALLSPLTTSAEGAITPSQALRALEGAYVALYRANRTPELGDRKPLIQLYLANEGSRQQEWTVPVSRIEAMADDEVPLVAVMGQALGTERTKKAAERLTEHGIPVVTGASTADGIDHEAVDGLLRAAPSNTDFVTALDRYLHNRDDLDSAVMVSDEVKEDLFVRTLHDGYEAKLGDYIDFRRTFQGQSIDELGANVFGPITDSICTLDPPPDMVFFAGRAPDLRTFLDVLGHRSCRSDPISVVFAEIGEYPWEQEQLSALQEGNITLLTATGSDPRWAQPGNEGEPAGFADFYSHYSERMKRDSATLAENLENGYAATYHDSLAITVTAIRSAHAHAEQQGPPPAPEDVRDHIMNAPFKVRGATGTLKFNQNQVGNPSGKYVPVVPVPFSPEIADNDPYITPAE